MLERRAQIGWLNGRDKGKDIVQFQDCDCTRHNRRRTGSVKRVSHCGGLHSCGCSTNLHIIRRKRVHRGDIMLLPHSLHKTTPPANDPSPIPLKGPP